MPRARQRITVVAAAACLTICFANALAVPDARERDLAMKRTESSPTRGTIVVWPVPNWVRWYYDGPIQLGHSVAAVGDVDDDGDTDFLVGAPAYSVSTDGGRVYLFEGSPLGPRHHPTWEVSGSVPEGRFGSSVAAAGDVDGDGRPDVIVGASDDGDGIARLYLNSETGLAEDPAWVGTLPSQGCSGYYGGMVGPAGDFNGDGFDDIVVGHPDCSAVTTQAGAAFVFNGRQTGPALEPSWEYYEREIRSHLGWSLGSGG